MKVAHKLTKLVLVSVERSNVKLTIAALKFCAENGHEEFHETAIPTTQSCVFELCEREKSRVGPSNEG